MDVTFDWSDDELRRSARIAKEQYQQGQVVSASEAIAHFSDNMRLYI